ncbi:hypothetical protein DQM68_11775 [Leptospira mayottensis]|uniref:Uncharacterized protein n=2 Tax=Leptospira mayottensis TaxID=1137606 RepID=A0AA87MLQ0_9LEPT|nr:hypothetical protein DQM68_11775 [Leptospira mayottensis]AXR65495.1 hypothetical protein DQM28_15975 [Leptospira mayottensis]AZQ02313.1 hypothetical protein LEP1GSC190_09940 [Leptospira mayottensis 200901116]EKR99336.1 hypothetical protein LEP1GSC125_4140 [Leptospira mayottensis 200901122]TGM94370.1 hypothetical protein EHR03_17715 [Leptospira mayottensis]
MIMGFLLETDHDSGIRARAPCEFGFGLIDFFILEENERTGNHTRVLFLPTLSSVIRSSGLSLG